MKKNNNFIGIKDLSKKEYKRLSEIANKVSESKSGYEYTRYKGKSMRFSQNFINRVNKEKPKGHTISRGQLIKAWQTGKADWIKQDLGWGKEVWVLRKIKVPGFYNTMDMSDSGILAYGGYVGMIS